MAHLLLSTDNMGTPHNSLGTMPQRTMTLGWTDSPLSDYASASDGSVSLRYTCEYVPPRPSFSLWLPQNV